MGITEEKILEQLKEEWHMVEYASKHHTNLVEHFVDRFQACKEFAEALTGKRYTATEDGVIEY